MWKLAGEDVKDSIPDRKSGCPKAPRQGFGGLRKRKEVSVVGVQKVRELTNLWLSKGKGEGGGLN